MNFIQEYRRVRAQEEQKHQKRKEENKRIQEQQRQQILAVVLTEAEIAESEVQTNGYWFCFPYKGVMVHFVNQANRLCGEMHRLPRNDEEKAILRDAHHIVRREDDLADQFKREFLYEEFVFYGNPATVLQREVFKLAENTAKALRFQSLVSHHAPCGIRQ